MLDRDALLWALATSARVSQVKDVEAEVAGIKSDADSLEATVDSNTAAIASNATKLLPAGGVDGQVLAKASNTSYDVAWVDPGSSSGTLGWIDFASHWDTTPTLVSAGVYSYVWLGVTRYRTVPDPYVTSGDAFYSDSGLTNLIVARGQ